jgi:hypothetical protein
MRVFIVIAAILLVPTTASARDFRVQQIPNGPRFSCDTCHEPGNFGYLNPFGFQVLESLSENDVVWAELANLDADNDGYPNGVELGDPNGSWRIGDSHPGGTPSNPGIYESNLCGNDRREANEECEDGDVGEAMCSDFGFHAGRVTCNSICQLDTSFCINCGNGMVDDDEECEGADVAGRTCQQLGYDGGSLGCRANCTLDTSACTGEPTPVCGDGIIVGSEECEGQNLGGASCVTLGWVDGGFLGCNNDCTFDTDRCLGLPDDGEEEYTEVPGSGAPALPPDAFANDDEGCSTASGSAGGLGLFGLLLGFGFVRRRVRGRWV